LSVYDGELPQPGGRAPPTWCIRFKSRRTAGPWRSVTSSRTPCDHPLRSTRFVCV